jgi:hypothetical protein
MYLLVLYKMRYDLTCVIHVFKNPIDWTAYRETKLWYDKLVEKNRNIKYTETLTNGSCPADISATRGSGTSDKIALRRRHA